MVRDRYNRTKQAFGYFSNVNSLSPSLGGNKLRKHGRFRVHSASLLYLSFVPVIFLFLYAIDAWSGYIIFYGWLSLQVFAIEALTILLRDKNGRISLSSTQISKADWILCFLLYFIYFVITASACMDLFSENKTANIYIIPNFISSLQCQQLITAAEQTASVTARSSSPGWQTSRHKYYPTTDLPLYSIVNHSITTKEGEYQGLVFWLNHSIIEGKIFPLLRKQFSLSSRDELYMQDAFIVKYDAITKGAQRHLSTHQDSSLLSFNIALSPPLPLSTKTVAVIGKVADISEGYKNIRSKAVTIPSTASNNRNLKENKTAEEGYTLDMGFSQGGTHFTLLDETYRPAQGSLLTHPSRVFHAGQEIEYGRRYILVGFVQLKRYPHTWNLFWRKFGAVARFMVVHVANSSSTSSSWPEVDSVKYSVESTSNI